MDGRQENGPGYGCQEEKKMLWIAVLIGFGLASLVFRKKVLPEGNTENAEASRRTVKATVDGKPVHSYIADDR